MIAVAIGTAQGRVGLAPGDVVATHDVALVEGLAVLGKEDVGELEFGIQPRVKEPALLVVLPSPLRPRRV